MARRLLTALCVSASLVVVTFAPGITAHRFFTGAQAAGTLVFGPTTVVDDQREGGEPDITVCGPNSTWSYGNCGSNNPYASAPYGFSTTSSWIWRSEDNGSTFKPVPSNNTTGKPDACPGGGDTDLAVSPGSSQASDFINFIDLQGLTNFSSGTSADGGQSFTCDPASTLATIVDRQWFGVYKTQNPVSRPANAAVFLDYDLVAGGSCVTDSQARGNAFVVQKSTDGGLTYGPPVTVDCNDGIAGNMQVDQARGYIYAVHTGYSVVNGDVNQAIDTDAIYVDRSTDGGATWHRFKVFGCTPAPIPNPTSDCTTGQDFAVMNIDKSGNLYVVWSQAPLNANDQITGPSHIYLASSTNGGQTWSAPKQVDHGTTNVNLFPWVAAGNAGQVDVVWYGTTKSSTISSYDPGSQVTNWYPYIAQSLNATSVSATFSSPVAVSQHPNHSGGICTMGIGCTTGGDRSLADFFQVAIDRSGAANVIWTDTSNNSNTSASGNESGLIDEAHQIAGSTLFGTTLFGTNTLCTGGLGTSPCRTDSSGDAKYEANGTVGPNVPKLDITGSSLAIDPSNHSRLDVRMKLSNLASLPNLTDTGINSGDAVVDYLTSWNYHIPGDTDANYDATGNIYYAYLEVNRLTGAVTAYDGNTCSVDTTKAKYFVYPGQNAISYKVTPSSGTIDLYVPLSQVGNPPVGAQLYSVTAHTVGQPGAAGPYDCSSRDPNGNNSDPTGQIFNVYDKSAAYTAKLTTP